MAPRWSLRQWVFVTLTIFVVAYAVILLGDSYLRPLPTALLITIAAACAILLAGLVFYAHTRRRS